ncbi:hypothetical protein RM780_02215 [Streptomyces sp. DSM 44917]|uniref:Nucleotide exchange factor GrpE n=1 Tax=Streptomyces boetiae TaxID=3075541 RepID=A0ABU2L2J1_9ACTN|nr:hypothetical protein [Streptomyces sp. DSM 44917]MDT0305778.1 hypothetical protein [Streptomyces sp. DSM 44917]
MSAAVPAPGAEDSPGSESTQPAPDASQAPDELDRRCAELKARVEAHFAELKRR